ncbi:unnamed protein product, partial [Pylaiella littoralis]
MGFFCILRNMIPPYSSSSLPCVVPPWNQILSENGTLHLAELFLVVGEMEQQHAHTCPRPYFLLLLLLYTATIRVCAPVVCWRPRLMCVCCCVSAATTTACCVRVMTA